MKEAGDRREPSGQGFSSSRIQRIKRDLANNMTPEECDQVCQEFAAVEVATHKEFIRDSVEKSFFDLDRIREQYYFAEGQTSAASRPGTSYGIDFSMGAKSVGSMSASPSKKKKATKKRDLMESLKNKVKSGKVKAGPTIVTLLKAAPSQLRQSNKSEELKSFKHKLEALGVERENEEEPCVRLLSQIEPRPAGSPLKAEMINKPIKNSEQIEKMKKTLAEAEQQSKKAQDEVLK
mmetsp:Transcript_417/g.382  ORF Transcript_417/g.382 Transcript_417/m.382 type:complete len:235 (+) Transcript_417:2090-2794(+)